MSVVRSTLVMKLQKYIFSLICVFKESTGRQRLPSSYPLELKVIGEWEDAGRPQNFNICKGFYHVLRAIVHYRSLKHAWTVNYNSNHVSKSV